MKLDEAIRGIYNVMFTPDKGVGVFSSLTASTLAETIEFLHTSEDMSAENENNGNDFEYSLEFTVIPVGEKYREYANSVFKTNENFNTKLFHIFLYPYYLEALVNASFSILSTDGIQMMADYVHSAIEVGNNQFANLYCLRNKVETLDMQNEFLLKEIEKAVELYYTDIEYLEQLNFIDLSAEFIGWSDNFPSRVMQHLLSIDNYKEDEINQIEYIKYDLLSLIDTASIFTAELKRV